LWAVGWRKGRLVLFTGAKIKSRKGGSVFFFSNGGSDQKRKMKRV
jgi:hypothetical protein